jgi:hypothetical protein
MKVAVLDTGLRGWRQHLGKGLAERVVVRSFRADGDLEARDSQHGILCAEIVHALAPDAELLLANWDTDSPATFLQAVQWAKQQGARIVCCSVIMPSWSDGEGGGDVHALLDRILGRDLLFFASAGNTAQRHWTGTLRPDRRGWHQWRDDVNMNSLQPWGGERVAVEMYGPIDQPCELCVFDATTGASVGSSPARDFSSLGDSGNRRALGQAAFGQAMVRFDPEPGRRYYVSVRCSPGSSPPVPSGKFHVVALGAALEIAESKGSIPFPGDGAQVLAVGAVDHLGQRTPYSSCGPNSHRPKPDLVAMVPFPSVCRERPFSGTSAAAPQAAALAALWWSRQPAWSATQVASSLRGAAFDLGPAGHDCETGFGLVRLP